MLQVRCGRVPFRNSLWNEWRQQVRTGHSALKSSKDRISYFVRPNEPLSMPAKAQLEKIDPSEGLLQNDDDFSLMLGGPLYQLYLRARLSTPPLGLVHRRVVIISLVCWLPLLLLSLAAGHALGGVDVPFLRDVEVHARFLVALPMLIVAEFVVHQRIILVVRHFLGRNIIAAENRQRFA